LARDASPVRAFATHQPALDPDHRQPGGRQRVGDMLAGYAESDDHHIHPLSHCAPSTLPRHSASDTAPDTAPDTMRIARVPERPRTHPTLWPVLAPRWHRLRGYAAGTGALQRR